MVYCVLLGMDFGDEGEVSGIPADVEMGKPPNDVRPFNPKTTAVFLPLKQKTKETRKGS